MKPKGYKWWLFLKAHSELMQEWKADHPEVDMEEAYHATRFDVYCRFRSNFNALQDEAHDKAKDLIDHFEFH